MSDYPGDKIETAITGDVFEILATLEPGSFDALFCDPPYLISFMGRDFDRQHSLREGANEGQRMQAWHQDWLSLAVPLLRPGANVVAASGSRVYHRLASAAEDAGFAVDPLFAWINGQAMAQGLAIDKGIDKAAGAEREVTGEHYRAPDGNLRRTHQQAAIYGADNRIDKPHGRDITAPATPLARLFEGYSTRLKDAVCPWVMAHKPVTTWAANAAEHGLAGLNVEAGRVPTSPEDAAAMERCNTPGSGLLRESRPGELYGHYGAGKKLDTIQGRYPPNVALVHAEDCLPGACVPWCSVAILDEQAGPLKSGAMRKGGERTQRITVTYNDPRVDRGQSVHPGGDSGGASRFFHQFRYEAKAGPSERLRGCEGFFWRVSKDSPLGFERITQGEYLEMGHLPGCRKRRRARRSRGRKHTGSPLTMGAWDAESEDAELADEDLPLLDALAAELGLPEPGCAEGCQHRERYQGNIHPTLKPIALCEYLARLILPPPRLDGKPRRVLIPFAGTFSEVIGAMLAGFDEVVAVEMEPAYVEIGEARVAAWTRERHEQVGLFEEAP